MALYTREDMLEIFKIGFAEGIDWFQGHDMPEDFHGHSAKGVAEEHYFAGALVEIERLGKLRKEYKAQRKAAKAGTIQPPSPTTVPRTEAQTKKFVEGLPEHLKNAIMDNLRRSD
jgi:hypothetical protein